MRVYLARLHQTPPHLDPLDHLPHPSQLPLQPIYLSIQLLNKFLLPGQLLRNLRVVLTNELEFGLNAHQLVAVLQLTLPACFFHTN